VVPALVFARRTEFWHPQGDPPPLPQSSHLSPQPVAFLRLHGITERIKTRMEEAGGGNGLVGRDDEGG
jgi:hypothetical protein